MVLLTEPVLAALSTLYSSSMKSSIVFVDVFLDLVEHGTKDMLFHVNTCFDFHFNICFDNLVSILDEGELIDIPI